MQTIDYKRIDRQYIGALKWQQSNFNGIVNWATGVGKGFFLGFCDYQKNILGFIPLYLKHNPKATILLISNSQKVKEQNKNYISEYIQYNNIFYVTITELTESKQYDNTQFDLLIADEVDCYTSQLRRRYIDGTLITYTHFLGITATPFLIKKYYPEFLIAHPIVDEISIMEATNLEFVAQSIEYNYGIDLPEEDYNKYVEYDKIIRSGVNKFDRLYKYVPYINNGISDTSEFYKFKVCLNACTKGAYLTTQEGKRFYKPYEFINILAALNGYHNKLNYNNFLEKRIIDDWKPDNLANFCGALVNALKQRDDMVKKHPIKLEAVASILETLSHPETITFSESSEFAEQLYVYLNKRFSDNNDYAVIYHSKAKVPVLDENNTPVVSKSNKPKYYGVTPNTKGIIPLLEYCIKQLDNKAKVLVGVKGLSRGFNRPSIAAVITTSYTESPTTYTQNKGRGIRINNLDVDNTVFIVNVYFKHTLEEKKLIHNQKPFLQSGGIVYWIDNVFGISDTPNEIKL